ncbi:MAG: amino acid adenylation domain-containing protein, partial [Acidobacteriota bacterium]
MKLKNVEDVYPLSSLQQGILFHSLYAPGSEAYVEQVGWTCAESFNGAAFAEAWRQVMARHPALRAVFFREQLKQPLQVVRRQVELPCERHDWGDVAAAEREERLSAFLAADRRRGFDLTKAPLMRLSQIRLAAGYQFVWTYHHLLLDGWSVALVLREVFQLYQALCDGIRFELEERRPFRDYIAWLHQQDAKLAEAYWRERLRGFAAQTPLGAERIHGDAAASEPESYRTQQSQLTPAATEKLRAFARQQQLTLATLVEGAWALLLARYSGEREAVFGTVVNGRPATLPGAETMIGLFINTLPLRAAVPADAQCVPWLKELQRQRIEMRQYEHSALAQIHEWSDVPGGQPLFRSIVAFDNAPDDAAMNEGTEGVISNVFRANTNTSYPLTVGVVAGRALSLHLTYDERRFDADAIARMAAHLENLLMGFAQDATQRLSDLPMLQQCERQQLLMDWCATAIHYPEEASIPRLFQAQVERSPAATAVTFAGEHLTYAELNHRSNQLAHYLRSLGVGAETLVGVYAERSLEMVVGLMGILKAGAAYVPLDPAHPKQSLAFMLADANVPVLLTQHHLADSLPEHGVQVLLLDESGDAEWMAFGDENPQVAPEPDSIAYAIYTSGSTGQPKAALNTHRAIANRLLWMQDAYGLTAGDAVLQKTPFTFDVSVWEFFWPLITGARLVMAEPGGHQDSDYLNALIANQHITTVHFVPSMLAVFLESEELEQCRSLKRVICSGEALSFDLQQRFFSRLDAQLHNLYGPTEAAVDVTFWQCERDGADWTVPIGRPIANIRIYLLDRELQPVPVGVPGELHIGGTGLARGYLRRPALTAEKFIPDPFSSAAGGRLYKTGDLARYRADGAIEFLGRLDHQVKIRGFRIELGEVEARLSQHPSVQEVAVVAHAEQAGDNRLVAYVTAAPGQRPKPAELRRFLSEQSPQYMVPSAFVVLERLPLTHNGKLDRRALPAPGAARPALDEAPVAPRTAAEQTLVAVWAEVLGIDQVGIRDNFFELGGDSIISMQIVARAKQEGLNFAPRDLFAHQTIAELAAITASVTAPQAPQGTITGPLPLAPMQRWFFEQQPLDPHHFNQAVWLEARQTLDARLLEQAIQKLLAHHDALRLRFTPDAQGWRQVNAASEEAAVFLHADLSELPEAEREEATGAAAAELQASLNLSSDPLLRAALFDYGAAQPARLLLVIHHLAVDGVSWRILLADLQSAYEQLRHGTEVKLPPKTTPFKQWAERLTEYARSEAIAAEANYWLAESGKAVPPLPLDFPGGENSMASARAVTVSLSVEETRALLQDVPRAYHTQINDALLTGLAQVFARWTGQNNLLLNLEGHGRENPFAEIDVT